MGRWQKNRPSAYHLWSLLNRSAQRLPHLHSPGIAHREMSSSDRPRGNLQSPPPRAHAEKEEPPLARHIEGHVDRLAEAEKFHVRPAGTLFAWPRNGYKTKGAARDSAPPPTVTLEMLVLGKAKGHADEG